MANNGCYLSNCITQCSPPTINLDLNGLTGPTGPSNGSGNFSGFTAPTGSILFATLNGITSNPGFFVTPDLSKMTFPGIIDPSCIIFSKETTEPSSLPGTLWYGGPSGTDGILNIVNDLHDFLMLFLLLKKYVHQQKKNLPKLI
jgi:hypothetical protein